MNDVVAENESATNNEIADQLEAEAEASEQEHFENAELSEKELKAEAKRKRKADLWEKAQGTIHHAEIGVQMVASACQSKWPCLQFDEKQLTPIAESTALVMAKHDFMLPEWLEAWEEEINLGVLLGSMIVGGYQAVQKQKKQDAKETEDNPAEQSEGVNNGAQPQQYTD